MKLYFSKASVLCIALLFLLYAFGADTSLYAKESNQAWKDIDTIATRALKEVKQKQYDQAKSTLSYLSEESFSTQGNGLQLSMEDMYLLSMSYKDAVQAVTQVTMADTQRYTEVAKFKLLVDALQRPKQPLWLETSSQVLKALEDVKVTVSEGDARGFQKALNQFLLLSEMIRPSIIATESPEIAEKLQSQLAFLERQRNVLVNNKDEHGILDMVQATIKEAYRIPKESEADSSFYWVLAMVGGFIFYLYFMPDGANILGNGKNSRVKSKTSIIFDL
ncbi:hypothetical protein G4V62_01625 [Bacillaceae bacterium SIJ1]|uniref:sporulation protein YpjB n=1 Tax=Litoribacterium kuwaitense TaxID=1398745 RepID=UPI0013EA235E|nr:sporulation protein YpjB [Litoribacterium kuwaitense]NGP43726.1 hypothetical protein [Litoribacterium kuwaitense]